MKLTHIPARKIKRFWRHHEYSVYSFILSFMAGSNVAMHFILT